MTERSKSSGQLAPRTVETSGFISVVPVNSTESFNGGKGGGGEDSYEMKSRVSFGDKQSGCYGRVTTKEKASGGEFLWKNGTSGTKSEYTESSTVRVGDKSGYTEVYNEQRFRNVSFDKSSGSKNLITYDNALSDSDFDDNDVTCDNALSGYHFDDNDVGVDYAHSGYDSDDY